ncbi:MAG: glycosyltransferase [Paludibacter sp.]|nr:glycosyltransferase [Paludibacter sp.]
MTKTLILVPFLGGGGTEYALLNILNDYFRENNHSNERVSLHLFVIFRGGILDSKFESINSDNFHVSYFTKNVYLYKLIGLIIRYKTGAQLLSKLFFRKAYDVGICFQESKWSALIAYSDYFNKKATWFHSVVNTNPGFVKVLTNKNRLYRYKKKINQFNKLVFVSMTAKEAFELEFGAFKDSTVIYNLLNVNEIQSKALLKLENCFNSNDSYKILMVGNLLEVKNYPFALDVFQMLNERKLNFEVAILGDGILRNKIELVIKEKNLLGKVFLKGFVMNPYSYYSEADLYFSCSLSEARPTACIDAIMLKKPYLIPDIPAFKEIHELYAGGNLYSEGSVESCVENFFKIYSLTKVDMKESALQNSINWEEIGVEYQHIISGCF